MGTSLGPLGPACPTTLTARLDHPGSMLVEHPCVLPLDHPGDHACYCGLRFAALIDGRRFSG